MSTWITPFCNCDCMFQARFAITCTHWLTYNAQNVTVVCWHCNAGAATTTSKRSWGWRWESGQTQGVLNSSSLPSAPCLSTNQQNREQWHFFVCSIFGLRTIVWNECFGTLACFGATSNGSLVFVRHSEARCVSMLEQVRWSPAVGWLVAFKPKTQQDRSSFSSKGCHQKKRERLLVGWVGWVRRIATYDPQSSLPLAWRAARERKSRLGSVCTA